MMLTSWLVDELPGWLTSALCTPERISASTVHGAWGANTCLAVTAVLNGSTARVSAHATVLHAPDSHTIRSTHDTANSRCRTNTA